MRLLLISIILTLATFDVLAEAPELSCDIGSVEKTFGGSSWLVHGCNDGHSVVVVSAPASPATPFYFLFTFNDGSYQLAGEGTGAKAATDAAYAELSELEAADIADLYVETARAESE